MELGKDSPLLHHETLQWCMDQPFKAVASYGTLFDSSPINFTDHDSLVSFIKSTASSGDFILLKGSRSNHLDPVCNALT